MAVRNFRYSPAFGFETKHMNANFERSIHGIYLERGFFNGVKIVAIIPLLGGVPVGVVRILAAVINYFVSRKDQKPMEGYLLVGRVARGLGEICGLGIALVVLDGIVTVVRQNTPVKIKKKVITTEDF